MLLPSVSERFPSLSAFCSDVSACRGDRAPSGTGESGRGGECTRAAADARGGEGTRAGESSRAAADAGSDEDARAAEGADALSSPLAFFTGALDAEGPQLGSHLSPRGACSVPAGVSGPGAVRPGICLQRGFPR